MTLEAFPITERHLAYPPESGSSPTQNLTNTEQSGDNSGSLKDSQSNAVQKGPNFIDTQQPKEHVDNQPGTTPSCSAVIVSPSATDSSLAKSTARVNSAIVKPSNGDSMSMLKPQMLEDDQTQVVAHMQEPFRGGCAKPSDSITSTQGIRPNGSVAYANAETSNSNSVCIDSGTVPSDALASFVASPSPQNPSINAEVTSYPARNNRHSPQFVPHEAEPLSMRTRSRQKRLPNSMAKEPAKRQRPSPNVITSHKLSSTSEKDSTAATTGSGDVEIRDTVEKRHSNSAVESQVLHPPHSAEVVSNVDSPSAVKDSVHPTPTSTPVSPPARPNQTLVTSNITSETSPLLSSASTANPSSPPSNLANNPYVGLSTAFLKGSTSSWNPYALYYGHGSPLGQSPTYPYPYFYPLPSPVGPPAMFPGSPTFPTPDTQKSPITPTINIDPQRQKPKRLKSHTVTSGNHNIPIVPRDKKGKPMLPLNVGIMTVIRLGEVCMREHFHTERYIFPVGYEVTRRYLSTMDPSSEVVYHCTILDGGDGPKFQIVPSDAPDRTIIAGTATGAWSNIVKQANAIRNRQHPNSVSGPDFFGLGQNTIKHLIQELPNADRLRDYVWQNFIEGGPLGGRHAAVTPALPEDYDSTLPIGALYPSERDRLNRETNLSPRGLNYYPQHIIAQAEAQQNSETPDQGGRSSETPINPSLQSVSVVACPRANVNIANVPPSNQQHPAGDILPQAVPTTQQPSSDIPSISPPSVPTTIAGIMSAYPVPLAPTSTPSAPVPVPAPVIPSTSTPSASPP